MNELKARFAALTEREQILVIISALVVVIALFYFAIWKPLNTGISRQQKVLENQQALLDWVSTRSQRAQLLRSSGSSANAFGGSLPQAVNATTSRHKISISRMQPQGDDLRVLIEEAEFNNVLAWLQEIEAKGVIIKQLDFAEANKSGHIQIRSLQLGKL